MKPTLITALLIVISTLCAAQTDTQVRSWQNLYEQLSDIDDMESGSLDDMYERLCELEDSPIDLNNAPTTTCNNSHFSANSNARTLPPTFIITGL